ncbi:hypothetical protein Xenpb_01314 [Xenorhabdus sp. PB62.4]|nr:hypothetical protein [Xenorhabdus sp. PB62.4]
MKVNCECLLCIINMNSILGFIYMVNELFCNMSDKKTANSHVCYFYY